MKSPIIISNKRIKIISLYIIIFGFISELVSLIPLYLFNKPRVVLNLLSPNLGLNFFGTRLFILKTNFNLHLNILDLSFYFIFLLGFIIFLRSKYQETRLLNFGFLIIFLIKITSIIILILQYNFIDVSITNITLLLTSVVWLIISYYALIFLNKDSEQNKITDKQIVHNSPKLQRLAHKIIDFFLIIMIFSKLVTLVFVRYINDIELILGERITMSIVIIFSGILYYLISEYLFKATPAKYITGSVVKSRNGNNLNFKTIFIRTISRYIPFEIFSFLGNDNWWHDTFSNTVVVNEQKSTVSTSKYLLIIPLFIFIVFASFIGNKMYKSYMFEKHRKEEYSIKINELKYQLKNISNNDVILFSRIENEDFVVNNTYPSKIYLKVNNIFDKSIQFTVLTTNKNITNSLDFEKFYIKNQNSCLPKIKINNNILLKAITQNYNDYKDNKLQGLKLINDSSLYEIKKIFPIFQPNIVGGLTGSYSLDNISIYLVNEGWNASLISIKNLKGNLNWINKLPQDFPNTKKLRTEIPLQATNYTPGKEYSFIFTVKDSLNNKYSYKIDGVNLKYTIKKVINKNIRNDFNK